VQPTVKSMASTVDAEILMGATIVDYGDVDRETSTSREVINGNKHRLVFWVCEALFVLIVFWGKPRRLCLLWGYATHYARLTLINPHVEQLMK
jgi:hypothetical protein